jgi:hypothetical protein
MAHGREHFAAAERQAGRSPSYRARLVVLSDRRPPPGAPRTGAESAIEHALREHDGIWLVRHAGGEPGAEERWAVLGGAPGLPRTAQDEWAAYTGANASYAERIIELISPDGAVWINGDRWLLVAPVLRRYGHRGPIGLLLDVPFPSPPRLEALPWYAEVMAALCELDVVGFRAAECAANFEACRVRVGRRRPRIGIFPADLEPDRVAGFLELLCSAARRDPRRGYIGCDS